MNKLKTLAAVLLILMGTKSIQAQTSLGGRLGFDQWSNFLGVSYKYDFKGSAIELNGAINLDVTHIGLMGDYYFFERDLDLGFSGMQWYLGAGAQVWLGDPFVLGPDGKIGLQYKGLQGYEFAMDFTLLYAIKENNADGTNTSGLEGQVGLCVRKVF